VSTSIRQPSSTQDDYIRRDRRGDSEWLAVAATLANEFAETAIARERANEYPVAELAQLRSSGLVNLLIPKEFGGEGGTFGDAVRVVAEISRGDTSIGAILGFHYYVSVVPRLYDPVGDGEEIQRRSASQRWLWANVHRPQQRNFVAEPNESGGFVINGSKPWSTGVTLADVTTVVAQPTDKKGLLSAVIPTDRQGLTFRHDWDHLGLRLAETVTADFNDVEVRPEEVLRTSSGAPIVSFPPLYRAFSMPAYGAMFIGATRAALERSRDYVVKRTEPRLLSGADKPSEDPLTLTLFGELWGKLNVAEAFVYQVADEVQDVFERRAEITAKERGTVETRASAARGLAAEVALEVTPRVYDLTGVSATANSYGLDRHWRDVRILSVHDSLNASLVGIGDFYLNGTVRELPEFV
jgi:alkylation response protein AidB-like acyl-CoA dehydrogenase